MLGLLRYGADGEGRAADVAVDVLRRLEDRHFESLQTYFREALDEWSEDAQEPRVQLGELSRRALLTLLPSRGRDTLFGASQSVSCSTAVASSGGIMRKGRVGS